MQTFMDIAHEMEHVSAMKHREEATGISFNPNHYKANKEVCKVHSIPNEIVIANLTLKTNYDYLLSCIVIIKKLKFKDLIRVNSEHNFNCLSSDCDITRREETTHPSVKL